MELFYVFFLVRIAERASFFGILKIRNFSDIRAGLREAGRVSGGVLLSDWMIIRDAEKKII